MQAQTFYRVGDLPVPAKEETLLLCRKGGHTGIRAVWGFLGWGQGNVQQAGYLFQGGRPALRCCGVHRDQMGQTQRQFHGLEDQRHNRPRPFAVAVVGGEEIDKFAEAVACPGRAENEDDVTALYDGPLVLSQQWPTGLEILLREDIQPGRAQGVEQIAVYPSLISRGVGEEDVVGRCRLGHGWMGRAGGRTV